MELILRIVEPPNLLKRVRRLKDTEEQGRVTSREMTHPRVDPGIHKGRRILYHVHSFNIGKQRDVRKGHPVMPVARTHSLVL